MVQVGSLVRCFHKRARVLGIVLDVSLSNDTDVNNEYWHYVISNMSRICTVIVSNETILCQETDVTVIM